MLTRRGLLKGFLGLVGSGFAFGAYAVGVEPMGAPRVVTYSLAPRGWPQGFKLRIVALADIHACEPWMGLDRVSGLVKMANGLGGDIVLLLGDYLTGMRRFRRDVSVEGLADVISQLRAPLGVHAVLGNHDWWEDEDAMRRATPGPVAIGEGLRRKGIGLLNNDAIRLNHAGRPFWLAGLGDQMAFAPVQDRAGLYGDDDLPGTLGKIADDAPVILMAHEPDAFRRVRTAARHVALTLSGHTHGGQVNLFGWRPASGSPGSRIYPRGHFRENGRDLIVSSGLGCSILPVRIGVPPEILVIELGG
jgi:uncharacterized protein